MTSESEAHQQKQLTYEDVQRLGDVRGKGTSVVSLYVKPGSDIGDLTARMRGEAVTAANIKCRL
jgi:peptide subunit release factor 1 (eRF1)